MTAFAYYKLNSFAYICRRKRNAQLQFNGNVYIMQFSFEDDVWMR